MKSDEVRQFYNNKVSRKFGSDYERERWFKTPLLKAGYDMTYASIEKHLVLPGRKNSYQRVLELGPGAGTWTKVLCQYKLGEHFDLLDISNTMLDKARGALATRTNIAYIETDFLVFEPREQYDLFFSVRALEYISDKEKAVENIFRLLMPGGVGFIITKTPKYVFSRLLGKRIPALHRAQISPKRLEELLRRQGFQEVYMYPVTMSLPLLKSSTLNLLLYRVLGKFRLNLISTFFSESYCVLFKKPC